MPTYTDLNNVKRILRSSSGEKVRFSDSLVSVKTGKLRNQNEVNTVRNLNMSFNYNLVAIDSSFSGDLTLRFLFQDDKNFKVFKIDEKVRSELLLSSGDVNSPYVTPDALVTVPPECWGGIIEANDVLELRLDSHISDDSGNLYIEDAESVVDTMLESHGIRYPIQGSPRLFTELETPEQIKIATAYLASYYIFTDTFADFYKERQELQWSFVSRWKKRAEDLVKDYIKAKGLVPPRVIGFPAFITRVGDDSVGKVASRSNKMEDVRKDYTPEGIFNPAPPFWYKKG
jgi:hypothetical protein